MILTKLLGRNKSLKVTQKLEHKQCQFITFKCLSATIEALMNVSFDTGLVIFVTGVVVHHDDDSGIIVYL